ACGSGDRFHASQHGGGQARRAAARTRRNIDRRARQRIFRRRNETGRNRGRLSHRREGEARGRGRRTSARDDMRRGVCVTRRQPGGRAGAIRTTHALRSRGAGRTRAGARRPDSPRQRAHARRARRALLAVGGAAGRGLTRSSSSKKPDGHSAIRRRPRLAAPRIMIARTQPETAMFRKILVPLDHSPLAEQAIGPAAALARAARAAMDLVLVHEPFHRSGYEAAERRADRIDFDYKYLKSIAAEITAGASVPTTVAVVAGEPATMIRDRARAIDADLIVMTSHGRTGLSRAWLGSTADALVHAATTPVLMLRPTSTGARKLASEKVYEHILVTLDGSARASEVLPAAEALAAAYNARLTLLQVVPHVPLAAAFDPMFPGWPPAMIPDVAASKQLELGVAKEMNELATRLHDRTKLAVDAAVVVSDHTA